ncbi:MAG: hypothetical protein KBT07_02730 [Clostridiales bacterium]|nr:hypothetical protein [Candidatus Scatonaster coprocaballi]
MRDKVLYVLKLIGVYLAIFVVCSAVFVALFHTPILNGIEVLMYRGLFFIVFTGILAAVCMGVLRHFWKKIDIKDIVMMFVIYCCVNTVFFVLVPVTVERSVSVFMLSYMEENRDHSFSEEEIKEAFTDKYVDEYGAFEKRFKEQIETGTIIDIGDGTYRITSTGETTVKLFRFIAKMFDTDERLVYPDED